MMMVKCMRACNTTRTVYAWVNVLVRSGMYACVRVFVFFVMNGIQSENEKKWARLIFLRTQPSQPIKTQA